jgi:hypothetical protein
MNLFLRVSPSTTRADPAMIEPTASDLASAAGRKKGAGPGGRRRERGEPARRRAERATAAHRWFQSREVITDTSLGIEDAFVWGIYGGRAEGMERGNLREEEEVVGWGVRENRRDRSGMVPLDGCNASEIICI